MQNKILNIIEIFKSIQGETSFVGLPFAFVRLAECNLGCVYCDTQYAKQPGEKITIDDIVNKVNCLGVKHVCITGGEPLLQENAKVLLDELIDKGYTVLLETNGTVSIAGLNQAVKVMMDVKCPGSKADKETVWENFDHLIKRDEVKFIITDKDDFDWAIKVVEENDLIAKTHVLFSPAYGMVEPKELAQWVIDSCKEIRVQIQLHKYIWGPDVKGV